MKELFAAGRSARVAPALHKRIMVRLDALDAAGALAELNQPGFDFHSLAGRPRRHTIHVNGPWCITFDWDQGDAYRVDLEQYH